jgi:CheY-like chemotaxis protein
VDENDKAVLHEHRDDGDDLAPSVVLVHARDRETSDSLASTLVAQLGCRVLQAETFEAALDISLSVHLHLVLLAVANRAEGLERLRALPTSGSGHRVPVVVAVRGEAGQEHLDLLRAGAHDAVLLPGPEDELIARVGRRLAEERAREGVTMARKYSLAGDLTGLGVVDLITLCENGMLTGGLELLTSRGAAQLLFQDGQIKHATFANTCGRAAFFELLKERSGQFEFVPGEWAATDPRSAVEGPNAALLLEGSQAMDENPDEAPSLFRRASDRGPRPPAPALKPNQEVAAEWLRVMGDPAARGRIKLLGRDQIHAWTAGHPGGRRLRLALVADLACGVHVMSHLVAPLALEGIADTLRRPPAALGFTWTALEDHSLEILLLDQERLRLIADRVHGSPAILILAPSYGDFLTYNMGSRSVLQSLLRDVPPLAILAVGNHALEGHVRTFLKLAKLGTAARFLRGSLWKLEISPRRLIEEAIRQWADLAEQSESRAA